MTYSHLCVVRVADGKNLALSEQRNRSRTMPKRTPKAVLLTVLSIVLVFGLCTAAVAASPWSDLPNTVTAAYGISESQIAAISEGYPGGLWKPSQSVTRAQFIKMAVAAFDIPLAEPVAPSFTDVAKDDYYYPYIEGAKAAALTYGSGDGSTFRPNALITRQQALAIISRYLASANGQNLATMYSAEELATLLGHFGDGGKISAELKAEMAFAYD